MKKTFFTWLFTFVLISVFALFSCSKSEDKKTETVQNYSIEVGSACSSSGGSINFYCISKSTYDVIQSAPLRPCPYHNFTTLDGQSKGGYLRSIGPSASCK